MCIKLIKGPSFYNDNGNTIVTVAKAENNYPAFLKML
jgi:hypothetical protein